ncbi:hypothetical protein OG596_38700 (plasmid) [Streptomyces sp. NBC_01102]|uniref:hypothetical protein n=1 Tax=Streptomyces sp. NBC_01102 TaxID=2903749 RepID=UPI002F91A535|nr:hypothetical protein OG596_38700 [Streptomyces sp. NBC_01102]
MYQKLTAGTVGTAQEIIGRAAGEIDAALQARPDADETIRPLRMRIFLVLPDLEAEGPVSPRQCAEGSYTELAANTVLEARTILDAALSRIGVECALRPPHRRHRRATQDRPLRATVHYDLADLDREGPLNVDECLFIPYEGLPPGLQPRNLHPEYRIRDRRTELRQPAPRPRRTLLQRLLGLH